jgi:hypothetical protein
MNLSQKLWRFVVIGAHTQVLTLLGAIDFLTQPTLRL